MKTSLAAVTVHPILVATYCLGCKRGGQSNMNKTTSAVPDHKLGCPALKLFLKNDMHDTVILLWANKYFVKRHNMFTLALKRKGVCVPMCTYTSIKGN